MVAGEHGNRRHQTAELRKRIVELRGEDLSFRQIAEEVGLSVATVWQHYQAAMRNIPAAAVAAHEAVRAARLEEQLRRIDMEREVVMNILADNHIIVSNGKVMYEDGATIGDPAPVLAAVDRLVKLDDQEARLLGLNAKTEISHTGTVKYELAGIDPGTLA